MTLFRLLTRSRDNKCSFQSTSCSPYFQPTNAGSTALFSSLESLNYYPMCKKLTASLYAIQRTLPECQKDKASFLRSETSSGIAQKLRQAFAWVKNRMFGRLDLR